MSTIVVEVKSKMNRFQRSLVISAIPVFLFAAVLAARLVWEETSLTAQYGPQMIGFSLAHGSGAVLLLAPMVLVLWLIIALPTLIIGAIRRTLASKVFPILFLCMASLLGLLSLPAVFWQWLLIPVFTKSPHVADLLVYAAAEGDTRTVRRYITHGVSVESRNYEGSTAAFTASINGSVKTLELLTKYGANLNAVNSYGDSPLEAASESHNAAAIAFLKAHGGVFVKGTDEQRSAASEAIVRHQIQEESSGH